MGDANQSAPNKKGFGGMAGLVAGGIMGMGSKGAIKDPSKDETSNPHEKLPKNENQESSISKVILASINFISSQILLFSNR